MRRITREMRSVDPISAARAYIKAGLKVVVTHGVSEDGKCTCGEADCGKVGKHPYTRFFPRGALSATTSIRKIRSAFAANPDANLAVVLDGLTVVDVDGPEGQQAVEALNLPVTASARSGRGRHLYFFGELPEGAFKAPQLDIITGSNRYVLVPPSVHRTGKRYRWGLPSERVAPLPVAVGHLAHDRKAPRKRPDDVKQRSTLIREGGRNSFLTRFAGLLRYAGLTPDALAAALLALNRTKCDPPLTRSEVERIAESVGRYGSTFDKAFVTLADVEEEDIHWLIEPILVRGALTVLDGDPGQGKSFFCAALASAISSGSKLPFAEEAVHGDVVILAAEDLNSSILKPRIMANGGDPSRIHAQEAPFTLDQAGLALLRAELENHRPVLVIIDPITAYMDASVDFHRANDTTQFLAAIESLAREFDCAVLIVRHLKKNSADTAIYRGIGSIAITARVRSGLILGRHPEEPEIRAVAHVKSNYAPAGPTILFELATRGFRQATVLWRGTTREIDGDAILAKPPAERGRPNTEREAAKAFLRDALADGPALDRFVPVSDNTCSQFSYAQIVNNCRGDWLEPAHCLTETRSDMPNVTRM